MYICKMKPNKEELSKLIFEDNKSYRAIGRNFTVSDTTIKKWAKGYNLELEVRSIFPEGYTPANKGRVTTRECINCNTQTENSRFCSSNCMGEYESAKHYEDFTNNNEKYCRANYSPKVFKKYFLEEQNHRCAICSMKDVWNNKTLIFVMDHIDGNAANNKRENLRLICHNCDSQLDTYKSKNKNSARKERYILNYKNIQ